MYVKCWIYCLFAVLSIFCGHVDSNKAKMIGFSRSSSHSFNGFRITDGIFNQTYTGSVNDNDSHIYEFHYNISTETETAVRIYTTSNESMADFPTMFMIRRERSDVSWQIPLLLQYSYKHIDVGRTLCPMQNVNNSLLADQKMYIEVSSQSKKNVSYTLKATQLENFLLQTNQKYPIISSPSNPVYYMYKFTDGIESVVITAESADKKCSILSIQDTKCPVFDLATNVVYEGKYQTMTTKGAITVTKSQYSDGAFYVVIVVKSNDDDCSNGFNEMHQAGLHNVGQKHLTLHIKETIPWSLFFIAIGPPSGVFCLVIIGAVIYCGLCCCKRHCKKRILPSSDRDQSYGASETSVSAQNSTMTDVASAIPVNDDDTPVDSSNMDHDENCLSTETSRFMSPLSGESEKQAEKNYCLYYMNLFTIAIFYGLPVIQHMITQLKNLNVTGNQDICYYNFACAYHLGGLSSFNNVFSNIGYLLFGAMVLIIVHKRSCRHSKAVEGRGDEDKQFGILPHFGLFYAMGIALCMEGIMSASYHICPTSSNIQYDTSFMYIMASLCILKIYANRHIHISDKSHCFHLAMAGVLLFVLICINLMELGIHIFWIVFAVVYMLISIMISAISLWKIDCSDCKRICSSVCGKKPNRIRFILLLIGNALNLGLALYGGIMAPGDFASVLLGGFIIHLVIYFAYYFVMKKCYAKEKVPIFTWIIMALAFVAWGFAFYFFLDRHTSWELSPAGSRAKNQECVFLQFYDKHDIWHFLSAISLFFSFLVLLTLDDEIDSMNRDEIHVF